MTITAFHTTDNKLMALVVTDDWRASLCVAIAAAARWRYRYCCCCCCIRVVVRYSWAVAGPLQLPSCHCDVASGCKRDPYWSVNQLWGSVRSFSLRFGIIVWGLDRWATSSSYRWSFTVVLNGYFRSRFPVAKLRIGNVSAMHFVTQCSDCWRSRNLTATCN